MNIFYICVVVIGLSFSECFANLTFVGQLDGVFGGFNEKSGVFVMSPNQESCRTTREWVLWNVRKGEHPQKDFWFKCSGEIRHFNIGKPLEGYEIYFGQAGEMPIYVATSNVKGQFSFNMNLKNQSKKENYLYIRKKQAMGLGCEFCRYSIQPLFKK